MNDDISMKSRWNQLQLARQTTIENLELVPFFYLDQPVGFRHYPLKLLEIRCLRMLNHLWYSQCGVCFAVEAGQSRSSVRDNTKRPGQL
jgi:hypothetical protein